MSWIGGSDGVIKVKALIGGAGGRREAPTKGRPRGRKRVQRMQKEYLRRAQGAREGEGHLKGRDKGGPGAPRGIQGAPKGTPGWPNGETETGI